MFLDELDTDEVVILNLCMKCQPSQSNTAMKVNTLSGKEAVSCDICGLTLSHLKDPETGDTDTKPDLANEASETVGTDVKQSDSVGTPKRHPNGLVSSDSVASLSDPPSQEKDKQDNRTILKLLEKGEKIR